MPGLLQDLFSKSKVFRFCYFFFFLYQILDKDLSKTFGATVIILLIFDLLRKQDDVYEPTHLLILMIYKLKYNCYLKFDFTYLLFVNKYARSP